MSLATARRGAVAARHRTALVATFTEANGVAGAAAAVPEQLTPALAEAAALTGALASSDAKWLGALPLTQGDGLSGPLTVAAERLAAALVDRDALAGAAGTQTTVVATATGADRLAGAVRSPTSVRAALRGYDATAAALATPTQALTAAAAGRDALAAVLAASGALTAAAAGADTLAATVALLLQASLGAPASREGDALAGAVAIVPPTSLGAALTDADGFTAALGTPGALNAALTDRDALAAAASTSTALAGALAEAGALAATVSIYLTPTDLGVVAFTEADTGSANVAATTDLGIATFTEADRAAYTNIATGFPTSIPGLAARFRGSDIPGLPGDAAATWPDISGNSMPAATQTTASKQPLITTGPNNTRAAYFNGGQGLALAGAHLATLQNVPGATVFVVAAPTAVDGTTRHMIDYTVNAGSAARVAFEVMGGAGSSGNTYPSGAIGASLRRLNTDSVTNMGGVTVATGDWHVVAIAVDFTNGAATIYQDGTATGTAPLLSSGSSSNTTSKYAAIGSVGGVTGNYWIGNIAEIVVYPRVLADAERAQVDSYLQDAYALPVADYGLGALWPLAEGDTLAAALGGAATPLAAALTEADRATVTLTAPAATPVAAALTEAEQVTVTLTVSAAAPTPLTAALREGDAINGAALHPMQFPAITGLYFRYTGTSVTGAAGTPVPSWGDSSGNAYPAATQGTASKQPLIAAGPNGTTALHFDGVDDTYALSGGALAVAQNVAGYTVFVVALPDSISTTGTTEIFHVSRSGSSAGRAVIQLMQAHTATDGTATPSGTLGMSIRRLDTDAVYNTSNTANVTATAGAWFIGAGVADYGNDAAQIYLNGSQVVANTPVRGAGNTDNTASASIAVASNTAAANYWTGAIAEIIVYNRTLTATERARVHSYLQDVYGVPVADYTPTY